MAEKAKFCFLGLELGSIAQLHLHQHSTEENFRHYLTISLIPFRSSNFSWVRSALPFFQIAPGFSLNFLSLSELDITPLHTMMILFDLNLHILYFFPCSAYSFSLKIGIRETINRHKTASTWMPCNLLYHAINPILFYFASSTFFGQRQKW